MKNPLSDLYEQILLNEAEKHALQNPSQDEVGNLKAKQDLFGSKPKVVEGPDKAKVKQGPSYEETTGTTTKPSAPKASMPNSAPAKETKVEKGEEMEETEVDPTEDKEEEKEEKVKKESFTMSAFETLFKKTLNEEMDEETTPAVTDMADEEPLDLDVESEEESEEMEDEGDLVSDLRELQDKLSAILSKLEDSAEEAETEDFGDDEEYTEEDFDTEFGEDEEPVKESVDKPKALNNSKGKVLMSKKNKVGKVNPKGGKAHTGSVKDAAAPKALGDKKAHLQKGKPEVKSTVKKGDFIK